MASHGYLKQAHAHLDINELITSYITELSTSLNKNKSRRYEDKEMYDEIFYLYTIILY